MKCQGFLLHHRWKWFAVMPHLEDPHHCGCSNSSIPMQNIQASVCCIVTGTCVYPWTLFRWSLNNHIPTQRKILFSSKGLNLGSHCSLSLNRSLFTQMHQNTKCLQKCQHSCSFGVELGERMFFTQRRGRMTVLVSWPWRNEGPLKNSGVWSCLLITPAFTVVAKGLTECLPPAAISSPSPRSKGSSRLEVNHHKMQYQVRIQAFCPLFHLL